MPTIFTTLLNIFKSQTAKGIAKYGAIVLLAITVTVGVLYMRHTYNKAIEKNEEYKNKLETIKIRYSDLQYRIDAKNEQLKNLEEYNNELQQEYERVLELNNQASNIANQSKNTILNLNKRLEDFRAYYVDGIIRSQELEGIKKTLDALRKGDKK